MKRLLFAIFCIFCVHAGFAQKKDKLQGDLRVIILRHAEKPDKGDNLSCRGFNRALQLPAVIVKRYGVPNYVYVPSLSTGKATKSARMLQTVWPLATKYNLPLNTRFDVEQTTALAQNITKRAGTVLVVWEHSNIPAIAQALGVSNAPQKWKGSDFDSIWVITIHNGKASFSSTQEGITPADGCTF